MAPKIEVASFAKAGRRRKPPARSGKHLTTEESRKDGIWLSRLGVTRSQLNRLVGKVLVEEGDRCQ